MLLALMIWALLLSSVVLYMSGFFVPEIRRKSDTLLSGLLFTYGLALAGNTDSLQGGLLWGQLAGSMALFWLGWQALQARWQAVPPHLRTPLPDTSGLQAQLQRFWQRVTTPTPASSSPVTSLREAPITLEVEAMVEDPTELTVKHKPTLVVEPFSSPELAEPVELPEPPESTEPRLTPLVETDPNQLQAFAQELFADSE